jgi:ubiquinone/menaquinone biosynthesis C-methylase UbiE
MALARLLHADPNPATPGITLAHGRRYDRFTAAFFLGRRATTFARLAELAVPAGADHVLDVLDVGCGTGVLTAALATAVGPRARVVGVDASADMIDRARATRPGCTFAVGLAESLDHPDAAFDVVASSLMIHHLPEDLRHRALAEMHRVLRPGGRLLVADYRPPASPLARGLLAHVTGAGMQHNPIDELPALFEHAHLTDIETGDLPWLRYVAGTKGAD